MYSSAYSCDFAERESRPWRQNHKVGILKQEELATLPLFLSSSDAWGLLSNRFVTPAITSHLHFFP